MTEPRLHRARVVRAFDRHDSTTLLGTDGLARQFTGDSAALVRAILEFLAQPHDRAELYAHIADLSGAPVEPGGVVDETLAVLRAAGAVREAPAPAPRAEGTAPRPRARLVLGLTGAVASAQSPLLIAALQRRGFDVRVAMTAKARRFVTPTALEALTHEPVYTSLWQRDPSRTAPHIQLAEWADAMLVCPASATTLARIAQGDCSDLVSATAISTRAPVVLAPSMNTAMYTAPAVQRNLETLRGDGFYVLHAGYGPEVAHRPEQRTPHYGVAIPFEDAAELVLAVLRLRGARTAATQDWNAVYQHNALERLPWFTEALDGDLAAALARLAPPPARLLDLGTGPGTAALEAARRGYEVTATDVSARALEIARARAQAASVRVTFAQDDVLASRLEGPAFDVALDRGCLHVLAPEQRGAYRDAVARLVRPGGWLLLKTHAVSERDTRGTFPFAPADVAALLGESFELVHTEEGVFPGPASPPPRAVLYALRRR